MSLSSKFYMCNATKHNGATHVKLKAEQVLINTEVYNPTFDNLP